MSSSTMTPVSDSVVSYPWDNESHSKFSKLLVPPELWTSCVETEDVVNLMSVYFFKYYQQEPGSSGKFVISFEQMNEFMEQLRDASKAK